MSRCLSRLCWASDARFWPVTVLWKTLCVLNLTTEAFYTAIFLLLSLAITKHLEVADGDFQHLVCAACRSELCHPGLWLLFPFLLHLPFALSFPSSECHASDALAALSKYSLVSAVASCTVWCFSSDMLTVLRSALTSVLHPSRLGNEQTLEKYIPKVHAVRKLKKGFTP